jgi:hypothetical protein
VNAFNQQVGGYNGLFTIMINNRGIIANADYGRSVL